MAFDKLRLTLNGLSPKHLKKEDFIEYIQQLQSQICEALEAEDGLAKFESDRWERTGGGGGLTRVIQNGKVFEKGGVNTSVVYGEVTPGMAQQLHIKGTSFFACGISLVIHPFNPMVPTVHANFRYFELYDEKQNKIDSWFGGGGDLTPYYLFEEDAIHFHQTFKAACDLSDLSFYIKFKKECDNYFVNKHRGNESRGIGGIFYDYLREEENHNSDFWFTFSRTNGNAFLKAYVPIVQRRKNESFTEKQKYWQEIRRGRYVEFNLIHDRGTLFGLKSNGRTESILMSLPPRARFDYYDLPEKGSKEEKLLTILRNPKDWV
jgi:coproporphyrinogen III oxidase